MEFINSPNYESFGDLYFNASYSYYDGWYKSKNVLKSGASNELIRETDLSVDCKLFLKIDFNESKIIERTTAAEEVYDVSDTNFVMEWEITGKTKIFNELVCNEAYTFFRGRKYFAYYYPYKLKAGPWKLHGLPGIILYAFEENAFVVYKATKVNLIDEVSFNIEECEISNPIDIKDYVLDVNEKAKQEYFKLFKSRLPAGARIESGEFLSREKAGEQELVYEWEIPENDKKKS